MRPLRLVALLAGMGVLFVVLALWLVVTQFKSSAKLAVDNRTPYATTISIGDSGIGCVDSLTVAPNTITTVRFTLHGPKLDTLLGLLCVGDSFELIDVANRLGEWQCFWTDNQARQPVVVTESGPTCDEPGGSRVAEPPPR